MDQAIRSISLLRATVVQHVGVTCEEKQVASSAIYGLERQRAFLADLYQAMEVSAPESIAARWQEFLSCYEDFLESARRHSLNILTDNRTAKDHLGTDMPGKDADPRS